MNSVEKDIQKIIDSCGIKMNLVTKQKTISFNAFLQPLRYKNKIYIDGNVTELRYENTRRFLLLSPIEVDVSVADGRDCYISDSNHEYSVNHSELVYLGNKPAYRWSIIHYVG